MVTLPTEQLPELYTRLMEQIKVRLEAVKSELRLAFEKAEEDEGVIRAESACLQIRKVTELIALAVVVAHNEHEIFRSKKFIKEWNADSIFRSLAALSKDAFPLRFTATGKIEDGYADVAIEEKGYLTRERLCKIYNDCGSLLHIGELKTILQRPKKIDLGEIQHWRKEIMLLLNDHVIFLPKNAKVMFVSMAHAPDANVLCRLQDIYEFETKLEHPYRIRRYRTVP